MKGGRKVAWRGHAKVGMWEMLLGPMLAGRSAHMTAVGGAGGGGGGGGGGGEREGE